MTARTGARTWHWLAVATPVAVLFAIVVVFGARALREVDDVRIFLELYPGTAPLPPWAPVGIPAWLAWLHFLNALLMVLVVKSGWSVRTVKRPAAYWTRRRRRGGAPTRISLELWFHLGVDILWLLNGLVYVALLFSSGHWVRVVPTSWDVIPNALSAALQYASFDWPTEDGWTAYNSLQLVAYFLTIFVAAPLAFLSGVRMSPLWPASTRASQLFPIEWARRVHFPVMLYFVLFAFVHVALVLATGALRNLGHMYAATDEPSWLGVAIFSASLLVMVAAVAAARPVLLRPLAALTGTVSR